MTLGNTKFVPDLVGPLRLVYIWVSFALFFVLLLGFLKISEPGIAVVVFDEASSLLFVGLALVLVLGLANTFVVERKIRQHMSHLTRALSITSIGESDYNKEAIGQDALEGIAITLEAFKSNAEELKRSNTELENFAYVAAHDLRSPLRAIQDLAEWTIEDEDNVLSDESRENLDLLQNRVDRLNRLLSDLLAYSRTGKEKQNLAQVTLPQVIQEARELLDPGSKFEVAYSGVTESVITYATPFRQVLLNLISNCIKHHDNSSGTINIEGVLSNGRIHVSVEDDGPGIERQYHDRIFGLFQTLRPKDEVEGSGLGLAIIRKHIDHYGGIIQLTSDPKNGHGTKFEIDFPVNSEAVRNQQLAT